MRDRNMRSGTELAREIQLTDWSTAGEHGKLVFMVSTSHHSTAVIVPQNAELFKLVIKA